LDKLKKAESIAMIIIATTATTGLMIEVFKLLPEVEKTSQLLGELSPEVEETSLKVKELESITENIKESQQVIIGNFTQEIRDLILHKPFPIIDGPQVVNPNESITYSAERSVDPDGKITRYEWLIDDKVEYRGLKISHVFTETGQHSVVLTVFDDDGNKAWRIITVFVQEPLGS